MRESINYHHASRLRRTGKSAALGVVASVLAVVLISRAQDSKGPAKTAPQPSVQTAASSLPPMQLDSAAALHHLNQVISWYRHSTTGIQSVGLPSDAIYQDNAQSLEAEVVRLAFQSAKAEAELISGPAENSAVQPSRPAKRLSSRNLAADAGQDLCPRSINCNRRSKV